ncbi:MAG: response regulator [Thermobispora bispora]|uniref:ATP-binding protein n=1 Tax=Thermobispora bispora TaxID=2006 RepID=UPI00197F1A4C|nr:ATP-binding protein [Thermobispora bispora]MBO2475682.1 histidine kinase [Actinomycetales bacterium]MBX6166753.1 response regulator [Thermobispora bispora]QSI47165.1 response regulator [Thermobispora bispora]
MTGEEITRVGFGDDQDAFAIRRLAREIAERVGLEAQDRIRMATALSEIVREVLALGGEGVVIISLTEESLIMTVDYRVGEDLRQSEGMALAGRLVDEVVHAEPGSITLVKRVPAHVARRSPAEVRAGLSPVVRVTAMDELREQNRELAGTLEEGQRLNVELTETNKGILALYNQLSAELEETNRGVVALYAELEEKSARLRELAEARQRFWVSVSHELRTPLNSIIGLVRLLLGPGGEPLSEEQEHQIRLIGSSAETLLAMVSELLDMAKAESGRIQPQPVPVDVAALADEARTALHPAAPHRVALIVDVAPDVGEMFVDKAILARILHNLLYNALKFTYEGEVRLSVRLDPDAGDVVFTVADTGIGIPAKYLERVFEEFFQVPGPVAVKAEGSGLGLPYARRLAEALGGTLTLTSREGEGTTATLRVPRRMARPEVNRVLIADGDAGFRAAARRLLTGFATHVMEAADGITALQLMTAHPPDVVLIDEFLPRMDGATLLQRMAEAARLRDVPVVVVGYPSQQADRGFPVLSRQELDRDRLLATIRAVRAARTGGGPEHG